jgi:hypothetical protein
MSKFEEAMQEIFDISPLSDTNDKGDKKVVLPESIPNHTISRKEDIDRDLEDAYSQTKDNLQEFIDQGKEAMHELLQIAKEGQHPRAFEVFGSLLKNMVDANDKLLDTQKKIREMDGKKEVNKTNIDKAIFVGSTAELSKLLKNNNEG